MMSGGTSAQSMGGFAAIGAVRSVMTNAVLGISGTPASSTSAGANRTASIATAAGRTRPPALFAIMTNEVHVIANICRTWVRKPNVRWTCGVEIGALHVSALLTSPLLG